MKVVQSATFRIWVENLKDPKARGAIASRLFRLSQGNSGDSKSVGNGILEMRIHTGPGYRLYFHQRGEILAVLLCGGDKGSQSRDIERAHVILQQWRQDDDGNIHGL